MADEPRTRRLLIPALLLVCTAAIYLPGLENAPLFVSHDEIVYSLQAHALASTGRDSSGRFLPMYIEYPAAFGRPTYDQPLLIYAIALALKALPFSEAAIRLPMVAAAIVDVLLVYWIANVLFGSELFAIAAAALLALTPAHFMHARTAIDFQLAVPFVLGWLLCLVLYLRRGTPSLLFAAGVILGVSLFGYVAAIVLTPLLLLLSCAMLMWRRDPPGRYGSLAAGILLPCLIALPWMLRFPLPFRDVIAHYTVLEGSDSGSGIVDLVRRFAGSSRLRELPGLYASFWKPEFLFIDGPERFRAIQLVGVFLVGLSGAIAVGVVHALRRRSANDVLVLAGFLTGPLVASLGGEAQTVWRTLQIAPFGVLLAVGGLRAMWTSEDNRWSRISLVAIFATPIVLASWYHDALPNAQGLVRAATVPLGAAGFAILLGRIDLDRAGLWRTALAATIGVSIAHAVFLVTHQATAIGVALIAALAVVTLLGRTADTLARLRSLTIALIAFTTATFMYAYVDYGQIQRAGPIPASVLLLAMRLLVSAAAFAVVIAVARIAARPSAVEPRALRGLLVLFLVATQIAYFAIDYFADYRLRAVQTAVVLAALVGVAVAMNPRSGGRPKLARLALAGLAGLAAIQFTTFYIDYFTEFSARGSADVEGNVRGAFETVIQRSRERSIPVIYLGRIGPYAYGELFWKFYLLKHHAEDLQARTIADGDFKPDRIHTLPPGSVVITSPTRDIDQLIDGMAAAGEIRNRELLRAPDGAPVFWLLEKGS